MDKWVTRSNSGDFSALARSLNITQELARLIVYRGMNTKEKIDKYLNMDLSMLTDPLKLSDMDKACAILKEKITNKEHIRIVGDYDVDGIMSTYILLTAFNKLGANVDYVIPDRIKDGYGISEAIISDANNDNVDTLITCDNGIAAINQVKHAKELGMTVVVTDHHDIAFVQENDEKKYVLPDADAVVNPHKPEDEYPFKNICGAVVAFKLVKQLYNDFLVEADEVYDFTQYAAMATVCDVMPLQDENRVIVREGLKMLTNTSNIGLKQLIEKTGALKKSGAKLSVYHLGFIIGPCLNATGRLESASTAIELLSANDEKTAQTLAEKLVELNTQRRNITDENMEKAFYLIDNSELKNDKVLVVYIKECHESIAGIIAGRIRERYSRPAIVITDGMNGAKGSGRSIEAYNMFEEITKCGHLLTKFGGHPMAAGISLEADKIDEFRRAMNDNCTLTTEDCVNKIAIDIVKNPCDVSEKLINELEILEPCGTGNEKAIFAARNVNIARAYVMGKAKNVLKLELYCPQHDNPEIVNNYISAIYFGNITDFDKMIYDKFGEEEFNKMYGGKTNNVKIHILYIPQINEYNGRRTIQAVIKGYSC